MHEIMISSAVSGSAGVQLTLKLFPWKPDRPTDEALVQFNNSVLHHYYYPLSSAAEREEVEWNLQFRGREIFIYI